MRPDSKKNFKEFEFRNRKIFLLSNPYLCLFWPKKRQRFLWIFSHSIYSWNKRDDPKVLTHGILGLSLGFLLNHRGSSMNLRFESIHRVLTRKFLSIIIKKKIVKPYYIKIPIKEKEIGKRRFKRPVRIKIKTIEPTWYFGIIAAKKNFRIFLTSYLQRRLNQRLRSLKLSITYPLQLVVGCFLLELYEMKFSYTVLRGGVLLVYLSQ